MVNVSGCSRATVSSEKPREADFQRVTFVGASQEDRVTPELIIDGVPRGAFYIRPQSARL